MANLPALTPKTFAEAMQFAEALAKSTMVPPAFQRNPSNILVAIQWGAELGLGPLQALQNIAVINQKPAVYGDAMLALVRGSPLCDDVIEYFEGEGDNRTAVCDARRKGKAPVISRFSVADARRAKLWNKAGPWTEYPGRMMKMRARGFALRDAFPDVLRGIISVEEAADIPREPKDITPSATVSAELDAFAEAEPESQSQGVVTSQEVVTPPPEEPRRRPYRRKPAEPTDAEIDRQQAALEAVLGPEELAQLDPAPIEEPPDFDAADLEPEATLPPLSIVVPYDPAGNILEWYPRARTLLVEMRKADMLPRNYESFRKANLGPLLRLKNEFSSYFREIDGLIKTGEQ